MRRVVIALFLGWSCCWVSFRARAADEAPAAENAVKGDVQKVDGKKVADLEEKRKKQQKKQEEELELLRLFADAIDQIERNYVDNISRRELIEAAIRGMLSKLDQHSTFIPPEDVERFDTGVESEFGGIGIQISIRKDRSNPQGQLTITSPIFGSPAYREGLMAGDHITHIEGESTEGVTLEEAVRRLKGKAGTKVTMTVKHLSGDAPHTVTITRDRIRVATVLGDHRYENGNWDFMLDHDKKIGYVRLTSFARHTTRELRSALVELKKQGMQGLILDLRFNPGGLLSTAISVSDLFLPKGKVIVSTKGRNIRGRQFKASGLGAFHDVPMVVLINQFSASASEIVSACLQDHQRAIVIGERSWGKGSVQNVVKLEDGKSALKLTTAGYFRPSGRNIHKPENATEDGEWGVHPNEGYEVPFSDKQVFEYLQFRRERDILRSTPVDPNDQSVSFQDSQMKKALEELGVALQKQVAAKEEPPGPERE